MYLIGCHLTTTLKICIIQLSAQLCSLNLAVGRDTAPLLPCVTGQPIGNGRRSPGCIVGGCECTDSIQNLLMEVAQWEGKKSVESR